MNIATYTKADSRGIYTGLGDDNELVPGDCNQSRFLQDSCGDVRQQRRFELTGGTI
ncbi:MAG: hypothetical protein IPH59_02465 [bacterium]|nr:hypothetical protein [bacterium]